MFCRNCGKEIEDNARFCRFCGQKLNETDEAGVIARQGIPEAAMKTETAPAYEEAHAGSMGAGSDVNDNMPVEDYSSGLSGGNRPEPAGNDNPALSEADRQDPNRENSTVPFADNRPEQSRNKGPLPPADNRPELSGNNSPVPPADNRPEPARDNSRASVSDTVVAKKKNNTALVIAIAAVAVLLIAVGILIFVMSDSPAKKYEEQLKLAERYLDELDYDKAIAAYRAAIDIDPKAEDAYLGLAEAYVEKGELQAAVDILKEGLEITESVAMEERLAELERQLAEQKAQEQAKLATPTPTPEAAGKGEANWRGGDWTNRDDILPHKNEEGYIVFGAYEQDGDESNGPEPIEWEVLEENGNGTFLVSRYVLDCRPYSTEQTDVTWESCTLRGWLNNEFLNHAFTQTEQGLINTTNVANPDHPNYGTPGGNSTSDRIFLLSADEVISHYSFNSWYEEDQSGYSQELIIPPTAYAKQQGVYSYVIDEDYYNGTDYDSWGGLVYENYSRDCIGRECAWWWLRSPGYGSSDACGVGASGAAGWRGSNYVYRDDGGLRPALYIEQ